MGIRTEDGVKRTVLAFDDGHVHSLYQTAEIRPRPAVVTGIRSLYYDQADSCHSTIRASASGLLALRQGPMGTTGRRRSTGRVKSKIRRMVGSREGPPAGNVGIFERNDLRCAKTRWNRSDAGEYAVGLSSGQYVPFLYQVHWQDAMAQ